MDITERKEAEERQALLAREVDHRAKNAMAIVQSIVRLTKANSISEYGAVIEGRLKALSRAHALLSDSRWQGAEFAKLVDEELAPFRSADADRIRVAGPKVLLNPTTAQTLALALHELATNAVKYGALSRASGNLELKWDIEPDTIVLNWRERGGPAVREPQSTGFGTRIITGSIERQLGGKATFDWHSDGLSCALRVPHHQPAAARSDVVVNLPDGATSRSLPGQRIMIVEDEALVAMILEDQLEELGISIVATCASVSEAMNAIEKSAPEAAILDVNLGGQLVYPVADCLIDRGIPFVFITGYGRESVDQRYSFVKILEKPVERQALEGLFSMPRRFSNIAMSP
jgi:two-component sensor histidine kinase